MRESNSSFSTLSRDTIVSSPGKPYGTRRPPHRKIEAFYRPCGPGFACARRMEPGGGSENREARPGEGLCPRVVDCGSRGSGVAEESLEVKPHFDPESGEG